MSQLTPKNPKRWYWLLTLPWIAALYVPSYNQLEPTLGGFPFFYWYQMALVGFAALAIAVVYYKAHVQPATKNNKQQPDQNGTGT